MKIRDFIKLEVDTDVCDNVYDDYYSAFCGPVGLKDEGLKEFADVLDYDISYSDDSWIAIVNVDYEDYGTRHMKAKRFFKSIAGYCEDDLWNKWFYIDEV